MRHGRRVSEVWGRAGMMWGVVWGQAREYRAWDAAWARHWGPERVNTRRGTQPGRIIGGLSTSGGHRNMWGCVSVCAHEVGHQARAYSAADAWIRW